MKELFSTDGVPQKDRFRLWRDICEDRLVPMAQNRLEDRPFQALIEGSDIGSLSFTRFSLQNLRASTDNKTIRHQNNKEDLLFLSLVTNGSVRAEQYDRSFVNNLGDLSIRDTSKPWLIEHNEYSQVIAVGIPRNRIESLLGSARHYAGLTVGSHLPIATLARSFIINLVSVGDKLDLRVAEQMASMAIDLVASSIAERIGLDCPKSVRATLVVQQAKTYITNNYFNVNLSPTEVASACGVSLRHLQLLFRENGLNIAAWIWQKRLEIAARRLSDPACSHISLGQIAYECGFADQSHFSRRFRNQFGQNPRDFRYSALGKQS